ncbi:MAG: CHAD domain-containing protein, partial [Ilumatobacteraceae bacterium]
LPDAVHQMRVAARRLRSGLKVFSPLVDEEWAKALASEVGWFAGELSASRDREVLEARLLEGMATIDAPGAAKATKLIRRELGHDEAEAFAQVQQAMLSDRYLALLDALVQAAREPRLTEAADATVAEALPPLVRSAWKRLKRDVRDLRQKSPDEPWHEARIRAKHARYAADALVPVFGKPAKRLSKQFERVTELLGRHQDAAIAAETARALADTKGVGGKTGYALGLLHDQQRAEVKEVRRLFVEVWPSVADPEWRHWLTATP